MHSEVPRQPDPEDADERFGATDDISPEEVEQFTAVAKGQLSLLGTSEDLMTGVTAALDRLLADPESPETFDRIRESMSFLVGDEGASAIFWAAGTDQFGGLKEAFDLPVEAGLSLRHLLGVYGPELKRAVHRGDSPNSRGEDWESIDRTVRRDLVEQSYVFRHDIVKFNGERFSIEGSLESTAKLATRLLRSLLSVPDLTEMDEFARDDLAEELDLLRSRLQVADSG